MGEPTCTPSQLPLPSRPRAPACRPGTRPTWRPGCSASPQAGPHQCPRPRARRRVKQIAGQKRREAQTGYRWKIPWSDLRLPFSKSRTLQALGTPAMALGSNLSSPTLSELPASPGLLRPVTPCAWSLEHRLCLQPLPTEGPEALGHPVGKSREWPTPDPPSGPALPSALAVAASTTPRG